MELRPPPPRRRPDVDVACAALDAAPPPLGWETVSSTALQGAWVGLRPDAPDAPFGRWLWDVVEPGDAVDDPLVLVLPQDLLQVTVSDGERRFTLTVDVTRCPDEIELVASALPPPPWWLDWATGWSTSALHAAAQSWLSGQGLDTRLAAPATSPPTTSAGDTLFDLGPAAVTGDAFDELLAIDGAAAAAITRAFDAVLTDLDRRGCLG